MNIGKNDSINYALVRHTRPAVNYKTMLAGSDDYRETELSPESISMINRVKALKQDVESESHAFIDLLVLLLGLSVMLYLLYRGPIQAVPESVQGVTSALQESVVFSDELLDLTESKEALSSKLNIADLRSLIEKDNLDAHIKVIEDESKVSLQISARVLFNDSSYFIARSGESILDSLLPYLKEHSGHMGVEVHTSGREPLYGGISTELVLSQRRAESLLDYFVIEGLPEKLIRTKGFGDTRPLSSRNRAGNGRVILVLENQLKK
jgi:flagellar motor protein MotB